MVKRDKIRIGVLYGGRSGEHEISLLSAMNVVENLDRALFDVIPIGINKQGGWYLGNEELTKIAGSQTLKIDSAADKMLFNPDFLRENSQESAKPAIRPFDVIFPVIHGILCEDGTVQGLLESTDMPYVGCGVLASAVGMDKDVSKRLIRDSGIAVPDYVTLKKGQWVHHEQQICKSVTEYLHFPLFVKPANTGSSVGVHKVKSLPELKSAINDAFQYDTKIVIEQGLDVIELEVAVLESQEYGKDPIVSVVGEVRPNNHEFYSYAAKYLDETGAELIIPASVSPEIQESARRAAKEIFNALECEGMARVDLFLEKATNCIYFNEVNTIPGFTKISMYPKLMAASGMTYSKLLTHLVMLAVARHERKSQLSREYIPEERCSA